MNTIVFVEDDAEVGALIAAYLAKHDMQVTVEPRGDRAEETILRENPDLVLEKNCSITPQNLIVLKPCVTKAIFLRLMRGNKR
ncbi:TPA: hypothetical protein ICA32_000092 [Escherichia coli]|nr:hypothetical protein [Escherichia coli]HAM7376251.1 hypothetical protein [Escherichia coli]